MPITGQGWEIHVQRVKEQTRGNRTRTVGTYQVFHDGEPAAAIASGRPGAAFRHHRRIEGARPERHTRDQANPSRILPGRYPLKTSGGPTYVTTGFRRDLQIEPQMPGIELRKTGNRTDIFIHPGKNEFLSSIGCINPCTSLPDANENIDYPGSRRRVIALIEDMKRSWATSRRRRRRDSQRLCHYRRRAYGRPFADGALSDGSTIDGRAVAAAWGRRKKRSRSTSRTCIRRWGR